MALGMAVTGDSSAQTDREGRRDGWREGRKAQPDLVIIASVFERWQA